MSSYPPKFLLASVVLAFSGALFADDAVIGRTPSPSEINLLDIDVRFDGKGLPQGKGTVADGEVLYDEKCADCHGTFGEGSGRFPALAGGNETLDQDRPMKTVGSFWPYAAPLFDYTYRTMPFGNSQSLNADQTYSIIAYVLYLNDLVEEDSQLDKDSLSAIVMPNAKGFIKAADKPDTPQTRCMKDCKSVIRVHSWAGELGVTPVEGDKE